VKSLSSEHEIIRNTGAVLMSNLFSIEKFEKWPDLLPNLVVSLDSVNYFLQAVSFPIETVASVFSLLISRNGGSFWGGGLGDDSGPSI
jgi:hypothetical protein